MATGNAVRVIEQGSEAWLKLRCGKITASRVVDVITTLAKGGKTAKYDSYLMQLVSERLTGVPDDDVYISPEMKWGTLNEPFARAAYEIKKGVEVDVVPFVDHPSIPLFGGSPDGLIGDIGLTEIKCPQTSTHLQWRREGIIPVKHEPQMLSQLACYPKREYCDFHSFDPRLPPHMRSFIVRMERDNTRIAEIEDKVMAFNREIEKVIAELEALFGEGS